MSQAAAPALEPANLTVAPTDARAGHVAAAVIGNTLECYDFLTYAYFAPQIGAAFFPTHTPFAQLMLSLATFGAGFISRPLGAAVIGAYGDRVGRRPAMLVTFVLMGAAILALALIPSYAMIGPAAPVLVLIARLVQGLALGGDMGAATTFLVEAAPARRRGLYGAWQYAGQGIASLAAGLIGVGLSSLLSAHELQSFGWRIAFLIGAAILPFGLIMRRRIPETLHAAEPTETPVAGTLWRHARIVAIGLVLIASTGTQFYTLSYMTTYAAVFLHMKANVAFAATAVFGGCNLVFSLLGGAASDRIGRRPIMIWPRVALMVVIIPAFMLIASHRNAASLRC
jgi:MHS family citrate/tricarballylate:H+ symporter-like MFS transporter